MVEEKIRILFFLVVWILLEAAALWAVHSFSAPRPTTMTTNDRRHQKQIRRQIRQNGYNATYDIGAPELAVKTNSYVETADKATNTAEAALKKVAIFSMIFQLFVFRTWPGLYDAAAF